MKTSEIITKAAGVGMLLLSGAAMIMHMTGFFDSSLFPGIFFGFIGLILLTRHDKTTPEIPNDVARRLDRLEKTLGSMQQDISIAHDEIRQLTDERAFMRQLLAKAAETEPLSK